jgi:hypothetical protein
VWREIAVLRNWILQLDGRGDCSLRGAGREHTQEKSRDGNWLGRMVNTFEVATGYRQLSLPKGMKVLQLNLLQLNLSIGRQFGSALVVDKITTKTLYLAVILVKVS